MIKKFKKNIKKILNRLGYTLIRNKTFQSIGSNDFGIYEKNDLLHNFYNVLINQNYIPTVIYDIGANKGTWTKECLEFFPNATYYLFEPQINLKRDIELIIQKNENIKLFTVGVGDTNGELDFTIHERDDSCSFRYSKFEAKQRGFKQIKASVVTLDDFVKENKLKLPSILKIDAEGLDLAVLEGGKKLVQSAEIIMIESGIMNKSIKNSALNVLNYLDQIGFRLFDVTDINRPFPNNILWLCELVFIKKGGILDKEYSK